MKNGNRVLLAEDNPGLARVLQFNLQRAGMDVSLQLDGISAWNAAQSGEFDVLVTDYDMPGMNGGELCERVRRLPEHAETPMVMVTGREMELDIQQLKDQLELAMVFAKPYSPKELVGAIQNLLEAVV